MPLPVLFDTAQTYLFEDEDAMVAAGLPPATVRHVVRLRDAYTYWLSHPSKLDRDVVDRIMAFGGIAKSQAYEDLKIVKALLGAFQKASQDYHRYRASEGIMSDIAKARAMGNIEASIKGWAQYIKMHRLDKPEREELKVDVMVQPFKPTDNPEVIGITRMPDVRERKKALIDKYWTEDVQDVDFEPIEYNEEEIFSPKKTNADGKEGLPQ